MEQISLHDKPIKEIPFWMFDCFRIWQIDDADSHL